MARSPRIIERNEAIYRLYRDHVPAKVMARRFGISVGLVHRVNNMMRAERGEASIWVETVNREHHRSYR